MLIFVFKTQFAQEKWLRKKMAKYVSFFRIVKPTGAAISRAFYAKVCLETEFTFFIFIQKKKKKRILIVLSVFDGMHWLGC